MEKYKDKITVLIPAYNEEKRIGAVLDVVISIPIIDEIIVVNDGSKDKTAQVVKKYLVTLISHSYNKGKAAALKSGIKSVNADILVTLDGDLVGLRKEHILNLLAPIISDKLDMSIGTFIEGRNSTDRAHRIAPDLSGQRAARIELWRDIFRWIEESAKLNLRRRFFGWLKRKKKIERIGYGMETLITNYLKEKDVKFDYIPFVGVTHVMKEEKVGLVKGFFVHRLKMYKDIIREKIKGYIKRQQKAVQDFLKGD